MLPARLHIAALFLLLAVAATINAQPQASRTVVLLDPAHGGPNPGAHLPNNILEKDVTLAFAARLRATLTAANFAIIATRDTDPAAAFSPDQRAGIANHARPAACLVLHATDSGAGVHLVTSALPATAGQPHTIPWDTAQSAAIYQSLALANDLAAALDTAKIPALSTQATLRPLDNLTCPAVAIELAPLDGPGSSHTAVTDPTYQQRIAQAVASALATWRDRSATAGVAP